MSPIFTEDLDEKIGATVDDLWMIGEFWDGIDHAKQLYDALDAIERTKRRANDAEYDEAHTPRVIVSIFRRYVATDFAGAEPTIR